MSDFGEYQLPVWAPRLRKSQVLRFYQNCASGMLDEEIVNESGFRLYDRCASLLEVTSAIRGSPLCPSCGKKAQIDDAPNPFVRCSSCKWVCPWALFQKTYQHKGLFAGGLEPFVADFVNKFPKATCPERVLLIDSLIHRFHWESEADAGDGRPGATSLIEGTMKDIMAFLDQISYGDKIPPEIERTREAWRRKWRKNSWSHGRGQAQ